MRVVIGVICSMILAFIHPTGSMFSCIGCQKNKRIASPEHEPLPKLCARNYIKRKQKPGGIETIYDTLRPGPVEVEVVIQNDVQYVIGFPERMDEVDIFRTFALYPTSRQRLRRIKIRVEGNFAYRYVPMGPEDAAWKGVSDKPYQPRHLRTFEIERVCTHELQPFSEESVIQSNPRSPGPSSSSRHH